MADSLREQLIAAGLASAAPEPVRKKRKPAKAKRKRPPTASPRRAEGDPASARANKAIAEKKQLKAKIKSLIDDNRLEGWQGDIPYRYQIDKKLREVYVGEEIQKRLASRELAITRLNGSTHLVPSEVARQIREINPLWSVFNLDENTDDAVQSGTDDEYSGYTVPDDLNW